MIKLFRDKNDYIIQNSSRTVRVPNVSLDAIFQNEDPAEHVAGLLESSSDQCDLTETEIAEHAWLPPIGQQEIWAAGVTYYRSRSARMEESEQSGGDRFYDMVYEAERPELFFKSTATRARGHLDSLCIRSDSSWNVPEPELTLAINTAGKIFGFTIGNDMSSRSIEGDNPLYLPQAKIYRGSCAIGPCLLLTDDLSKETKISITIVRNDQTAFQGETDLTQIKRSFEELAEYLFRDNEFPFGTYLMTGTGIVPDSNFTLRPSDKIQIEIESIGTLTNFIEN